MKKKKQSKIISLLSFIGKPLYEYYKFLSFNKVLSVKGISTDGVHIFGQPADKEILYVIKLESSNNYFEEIGLNDLKSALRHSSDSQFTYFFVKNKNFQVGYISTFSKEVAMAISDKLSIPLLSPTNIIQFLFDIYKVTEYYDDATNLTIKPTISAKRTSNDKIIDAMMYNLTTVLKEGAFGIDDKYKLFQVAKYTNKQDFNYVKNFRKNFDGILQIAVDLSDSGTNYIISNSIRYANILDKEKSPEFQTLYDESKTGKLNTVVVNAVMLVTDTREAHNTAGSLGVELVEKKLNKIDIISKSLMLTREMDYDALLPTSYVENLVGIRTKRALTTADVKKLSSDKSWVDIKIDFNGRDLFDAPTNFCFRANENPHAVLIADAGTGKSVAIQKILKTILRYSISENKIDRFKEVKTRYFEIGGSSTKLLNAIKELYPSDVGIINGAKEAMRFSITDIKVIGETEDNPISKIENPKLDSDALSIAVSLLSVILEETNEDPLSSPEEAVFNTAIKDVYLNKKYKYKTLKELKMISELAYDDVLDEATKQGYSDMTRIDEIEGIRGLGKLQKPTVEDVMQNIKKRSNASDMNEIDRETHNIVYKKLRAVSEAKAQLFGGLSSLNFDNKQFYSFEFNQLKEDAQLLRIVFTFLFAMVYRKDIEYAVKMKNTGGVMPQVIYIFEEARNFVYGNESITRMLEKTVFEGRKFQIHSLFVAQQVEHIPLNIIKGCSTFMFLMPQSKEKRVALASDIRELFPKQETVEYLMEHIPFRALGIISSQGVSSCRLELTQEELEMFAN
jgi:hypothetical protein